MNSKKVEEGVATQPPEPTRMSFDEVAVVQRGRIRTRTVDLADRRVVSIELATGARWSEDVGHESGLRWCPTAHTVVVVSGSMVVDMSDGSSFELHRFDVAELPSGHDVRNDANELCLVLEI